MAHGPAQIENAIGASFHSSTPNSWIRWPLWFGVYGSKWMPHSNIKDFLLLKHFGPLKKGPESDFGSNEQLVGVVIGSLGHCGAAFSLGFKRGQASSLDLSQSSRWYLWNVPPYDDWHLRCWAHVGTCWHFSCFFPKLQMLQESYFTRSQFRNSRTRNRLVGRVCGCGEQPLLLGFQSSVCRAVPIVLGH